MEKGVFRGTLTPNPAVEKAQKLCVQSIED